MNLVKYLQQCSILGETSLRKVNPEIKIMQYKCTNEYTTDVSQFDSGRPLFTMEINSDEIIASGSEGGYVYLNSSDNLSLVRKLLINQNAIFDLKWRPAENRHILLGSGDCSIYLYDVSLGERLASYHAHESSVRTISFFDSNAFVSGGRDGCIKLWDLREQAYKNCIQRAHCRDPKNHLKQGCKTDNRVTVVVAHKNNIYSGGTSDGCIKVWDGRKFKKDTPVDIITYPKGTSFSDYHGFSSMAISNNILYAACSNSTIYAYSLSLSKLVNRYKGYVHRPYCKLAVNDEYLVIGSCEPSISGLDKNNTACVWSLTSKVLEDSWTRLPKCKLSAHDEIGATLINPINSDIFVGCDQGIISKWSLFTKGHEMTHCSPMKLIPYKRNLNQIFEPKPPTPKKYQHLAVQKRRRSGSGTPIIKKRQRLAPLTPITNYFQSLCTKKE